MHESKLCLSLIAEAESQLVQSGAERIVGVRLAVGERSGVAPESLTKAFSVCAVGTRVEGAEIVIDEEPGRNLVLRSIDVA